MAMSRQDYTNKQRVLQNLLKDKKISREDYNRQMSNLADQFGAPGPDLETFETLLNKLTGSKMQQAGQEQQARRGDIYAGGLASMMTNF